MPEPDFQNTKRYEFKVDKVDAKKRLDIFLSYQDISLSRSQIKRLIDENLALVNGLSSKAGLKLNAGDKVELFVPPPRPIKPEPEDIPLEILFEDDSIVVINKPAGLVVHPAAGNYQGTLVNALLFHFQSLSHLDNIIRPGIVHRLDKDTSGLMVIAKNVFVHQHLARQFKEHLINKRYIALVHGVFKTDHGTIISEIGRHPVKRQKMSTRSRVGRKSITHWKLIKRFDLFSLLEISPETGRTHQIRVHLADQHHPILGDPVYSGKKIVSTIKEAFLREKLKQIKRQMLHAGFLGFRHPKTQKYLEFFSPLPKDMSRIIAILEGKEDDYL
jgi:23S rRNA pseudouridine1911/1915/1917 synthase